MLLKKTLTGTPGEAMSNADTYQLVCGMEVHAELKTASKMFCGCKNDPFHAKQPNSHTCPVCLGLPGGLPVPNKKAIEWTIKLGLALNCNINLFSKFDRKHYFYPDLPKGYQISQYDIPFCYDGYLETPQGRVGITRIHLEEDTAKLQHTEVEGKKVSLIDFNRSGVPLIEIVSEPDITTAEQAAAYGRKLREVIRYLEISDCDMEQGGMRLEANVSLTTPEAKELPNYKVELKNINSFKFLELAITAEIKRHSQLLNSGETPAQETRGFNQSTQATFSQRSKESAEDYRYFPDPDIPPIHLSEADLEGIKKSLPQSLDEITSKWQQQFAIPNEYIERLVTSQSEVSTLDQVFQLASTRDIKPSALSADFLNKKITLSSPEKMLKAYSELHSIEEIDEAQLESIISEIIANNSEEHTRYNQGETKLLNFFIGQVMKQLGKKVDMNLVRKLIQKQLES